MLQNKRSPDTAIVSNICHKRKVENVVFPKSLSYFLLCTSDLRGVAKTSPNVPIHPSIFLLGVVWKKMVHIFDLGVANVRGPTVYILCLGRHVRPVHPTGS